MHIQWLTFSHNIYVLSFYKKGSEAYKYKEDNNLENQNPINMKDLDKVMNELNLCEITSEDLGLIRRYLERLIFNNWEK